MIYSDFDLWKNCRIQPAIGLDKIVDENMKLKKINENYKNNIKNHKEEIERIVEEMMAEEVNTKPFDFLFRHNARGYPETNHKILDLPGVFKQLEDTAVFVIDNGELQMDLAESILPDGKLVKREASNNVEHQSTVLTDDKIQAIYEYYLYMVGKYKKPCYTIVVTNIDYGVSEKIYEVDGMPIKIYFRTYDREKIYKILNSLSRKDYDKETLSEEDFLNLIYCIVFAKEPYAKDIIEKSTRLFVSMNNIELEHQMDLHLALKIMIKYHFKGNNKQIRERLTMITNAVHESAREKIPLYERISLELIKAKGTITQQQTQIEQKDTKIEQIEKENKKLKEKIKKLENNQK